MVYLNQQIQALKEAVLSGETLSYFAYWRISNKDVLNGVNIHLSGEEGMAAKGYADVPVDSSIIERIATKKAYKKGFHYSDNIYKLVGIGLASNENLQVKATIEQKFSSTSLRNKYFIAKYYNSFEEELTKNLPAEAIEPFDILLSVLHGASVSESVQKEILYLFSQTANDLIDLLLLEDIAKYYVAKTVTKELFINKPPYELVVGVLNNFDNAVRKITGARRKDHPSFAINDEYDVQDVLYVILKSIFPKLKDEDPTPRVGAKYNKIDLILRDQGILVEVKMIKKGDSNEKKFVEELKNDIQSYNKSQWLEHLICFVYDPFNKTKDKQNFYDLDGTQTIDENTFSVKVIVV
jgi:hypothetical protein